MIEFKFSKGSFARSRVLLMLFCVLLGVACYPSVILPTAVPLPTPSPSPSLSPSPSGPPPSTPTLSHTAVPRPAAPAPPDRPQVLRPEFQADLDLFPTATRYEIELVVHSNMTTVTGHQHVAYTNTEAIPLDAFYLRLFPNTPGYGGAMTINRVLLDGEPVAPARELNGSALRFPLRPPLEPGAGIELEIDFALEAPTEAHYGYRQFGYYDEVLALPNAYPLVPVYDDEGWNVELPPTYGDAIYSETAFYTVRVTAPAEMTLVASGTCDSPALKAGEDATWMCVAAPMRDFNLVLGADYGMESRAVEGVTVNSVFPAGQQRGGERILDWAAESMRVFNARFGPYPFTELDVVATPTDAGGIEYPGMVVINEEFYASPSNYAEWVVVHEVAHQWWYSLVGNDQVDEPWLDEALTQYSTLLYFEDRYGASVAEALLERMFQRPYEDLKKSGEDLPAGLPVAAYEEKDYGRVVYRKGPLYFHALRQEVGDENFSDILRTYFASHRYGVATAEDWLAAVETVVGDEQRALYDYWILGAVSAE